MGASFHPFYEWLPDRFSIPLIAKLLLAMVLGFLFFGPHYRLVGEKVLDDWSWLLCLIIVTSMTTLYYATHVFRNMFAQMNSLLRDREPAEENEAYMDKVEQLLSNKRFIWFGAVFAVLNCLVGAVFGVPSKDPLVIMTTYAGFLLAGFVCGMAVCGIVGVVITLTKFLDSEPKIDYTNPDECGGLLFFGEALIRFSGVTLIVGVLISLYIVAVNWASEEAGSALPPVLMWMWIALPFVLSLTVLLAPASRANRTLTEHKIQTAAELVVALDNARNELENAETADQREEIRDEIKYFGELRTQLHRMRVWPFNAQSNIKFLVLFISNAIVALESIRGLISSGASFLPWR